MAMTLDGKVERPDGKWYGLSSREDKRRMDLYRSNHEVLILGKNSVLNDNPVTHLRYASGEEPQPVILLRTGTLPVERNLFRHTKKKPFLLTTRENIQKIESELNSVSIIKILGDKDFLPGDVIRFLMNEGFQSGLLEGGPTLNAAFLQDDLVDSLYLTIIPFLIGKSSLKSICNFEEELSGFDSRFWKLENAEQIQNEIFCKYTRIRS